HRGVVFEPFFHDEVVLAVPQGHRFAGRTVTLDELKEEPLVLMQDGAGVRQVIDDELRAAGVRPRDLDVRLELGLQESARSAVLVASLRWDGAELPLEPRARWREVPSHRIEDAAAQAEAGDGVVVVGGGSAIDLGKAISAAAARPLVSVPTTYSGAEWTPYFGV